ncbi:MAG: DnaJ domain-containing protein [Flavobacteriales bacterium]
MISLSDCYTLLELPSGANEAQVRSAFRKLALQWHPDRNKDPDATEHFVRIHEAYDTLIHHLTQGKKSGSNARTAEAQTESTESPLERARRNARMRYEDYLQSDQYQQDLTHESFNDFFGFVLSLIFAVGLPLVLLTLFGKPALPATIALFLITSMLWLPGLRNIKDVDFSRMKGGFLKYYMESLLAEVLALCAALIWLGTMGFRMFLKPMDMFLTFLLLSLVWLGIIWFKRYRPFNRYFMALTASALCIAIAFSLNNIFGYNLREEKYHFEPSGYYRTYTANTITDPFGTRTKGKPKMVTEYWPTIELPELKYDAFPQIRFCLKPAEVEDQTVTYVIGTGLFGIDYLSKKQIGIDSLALDY